MSTEFKQNGFFNEKATVNKYDIPKNLPIVQLFSIS